MKARRDAKGRAIAVGDLVRVSKTLGVETAPADYRRSFGRCAGKVFPVVGWDRTGAAWIPLGHSGVLSIEPTLLSVVRKAARKLASNSALLTDTYTSPLRARRGAAKRERWAASQAVRRSPK